MKQTLLSIILMLLPMLASADAVEINGLYYNLDPNSNEAEVTSNPKKYRNEIVIPESVEYEGVSYKVTSIGFEAFKNSDITNVTIPNSVNNIGEWAFDRCRHLTNVTIPNSITSIGEGVFYECGTLTNVTIPNSVTSIGAGAFAWCGLTNVTIPNSVTSIGAGAFQDCRSLISVTIPNSVVSIGENAFTGCYHTEYIYISDLVSWCNIEFGDCGANPLGNYVMGTRHLYIGDKEVKDIVIPDGITSLKDFVFFNFVGLTSITIPNSVTSIGQYAFYQCENLTSVNIPNSVISIGDYAYGGCPITSITIPNSVKSIGSGAFSTNLTTVVSQIENPFAIVGKSLDGTFNRNTFDNATLYVPAGTIDKYKSTEGWKDFAHIEAIKKCASPTINYQNGKLIFNSDTEGAICQYTITDDDIKSGNGNEVQLGVTYRISVYATKGDYESSDVVTATLCWLDEDPKMEGIVDNSIANVRAKAVLIQSNGSTLTITGADDGTLISVYDTSGRLVGSAQASTGTTTISTSLCSGEIGIVKIGEKAVKVMMK